MEHFLCTRFNLRNEKWKNTKMGSTVLTESWLYHRFNLFETYCLPSVLNQTNQNFKWLIFFDTNTPEIFKKKIESLSLNGKSFTPIYVDGIKDLVPSLKFFIKQNVIDEDSFVITSRLDNDDAIHKDFIRNIQEQYVPIDDTVIDLVKGYQLNISDGNYEVRNYFKYYNPFISVIESVKNLQTIYGKMHFEWHNSKSVISYNNLPMWIEIIHDKNQLNDIKNKFYLTNSILLKDFGINENLKFYKNSYIFIYNYKLKFSKLFAKIKTYYS